MSHLAGGLELYPCIGKLHPHMLRHTYLTRLYNVEHDLRFVQDQAGHASPTTTAIYAKTNSKARKRQVEALDGD
ncbi:tyrosine-type recombinase/integrase [Planctomycetota bacterium]